jgi:hypothetical protein
MPLLLVGFACLCALLLAVPGQTVVTRYLPELFIPLDQAYRVVAGQVPNRDFHTALGPLASYVPAAGYLVSGRLGSAMPVGMALVTVLIAPVIAYILLSRLRAAIALPFGLFLILILIVPINLGEGVTALSFAKFYNNIGWAALGALLVMYVPRRQRDSSEDLLDLTFASLLTLVMLYTKLSYGLAALAFLSALVFDPRQRRWAAGALALCVVAAAVVELFWRGSASYLADVRQAAEVSGLVRGTTGQIIDHVLGNLADYVLLAVFAGVSLSRTRSVADAAFYLACAVGGFLIINQNFQFWGILSIHAAAAVAAEKFLRVSELEPLGPEEKAWSLRPGIPLLFLALVLPTIVHCSIALGLHATAAATRSGRAIALAGLDGVRLANLWTWSDYDSALPYITAIEDGAARLSSPQPQADRVAVLGLANPFSAALGLTPARGDASWLLWGRNIDGGTFLPGSELFSDVQIVLEPKPPAEADTSPQEAGNEALRALYRPYLAERFETVLTTEHWTVHRRVVPPARDCPAPCPVSPGGQQGAGSPVTR